MSLQRRDIEHVAALARLRLDGRELDRLTAQIGAILDHFTSLRTVDVTGVEPFAVAAEGAAPLRADEPGADALAVEPAALAPVWREGFFTVPRLAAQRGAAGAPDAGDSA